MNGMILVSEGSGAPVITGAPLDEQGYALMLEQHTSVCASSILAAYRSFGEACARHLCGDFAFVLWDAHNQRLIASRSITGRCPLYVARLPHGICWSSDPVALLNHVSGEANLTWIAGWLLRSEDSWDGSPWQAIDPVCPGNTQVYDVLLGHMRTQTTWIPPTRLSVNDLSFAEAVERFRSLFFQSIVTRLREHQQVSFDCSGGLDSSSLVASVAYLQEQGRLPPGAIPVLHGYSERFSEEDGRPYLMALTKRYPAIVPHFINYDTIYLHPLVIQELRYPTTQAILLPALFQERVQQIISIGSTLHLSGEYGDHLFGPTVRWIWHQHPWRVARELWAWRSLSPPQHLLYRAWLSDRSAQQRHQKPPPWIAQAAIERDQQRLQQREHLLRQWLPDPFQRNLIGNILRDQALLFLAETSHTVAFPYLDQALLEFFCLCPLPWLMAPWQQSKSLLRTAMQAILPELLRNRTDKGNATRVVSAWSRQHSAELKALAVSLPAPPFVTREGLISAITRMGYGDCRDQRFVYQALALALFIERR